MKKKILLIFAFMLLLFISIGCTERIIERPPNPDVTSFYGYSKMEGFDYVCYVEVMVHNYGGDGMVKIWARVSQGGKTYTQFKTSTMREDEDSMVKFRFDEASFWDISGIYYRAWATAY